MEILPITMHEKLEPKSNEREYLFIWVIESILYKYVIGIHYYYAKTNQSALEFSNYNFSVYKYCNCGRDRQELLKWGAGVPH
jgi:hypothetical protein